MIAYTLFVAKESLRGILSVWEGIQGKKMLQQFFSLDIEPILSFLTKEIGGEM
jgi:L-rhamnose isomerase